MGDLHIERMPLLSCLLCPGVTTTAHEFSAKWKIAAETLGKSFKNSQNCCLLTCVIAGLIGSTCSQISFPVSPGKQLKAFSLLPGRQRAILLQSFAASSVESILLALIGHTHHKNRMNLSFHIFFIRNINSSPSKLSYSLHFP